MALLQCGAWLANTKKKTRGLLTELTRRNMALRCKSHIGAVHRRRARNSAENTQEKRARQRMLGVAAEHRPERSARLAHTDNDQRARRERKGLLERSADGEVTDISRPAQVQTQLGATRLAHSPQERENGK